jgi:hypothetical protein
MCAEKAFLSQIARIRRRVAVAAACDLLLNAGLVFAGLQLIALLAAISGLTEVRIHRSWYWVSMGISVSVSMLAGLVTKRNFLQILAGIDRRLNLKERLSTAFEYHKFKKDAQFTDLLIQEAAAEIARLNGRQLVPVAFSRRHTIFILMAISVIALHVLDDSAIQFKSARPGQEAIEHAGTLLRNYTFRRIENKTGPQPAIARRLEQLAERMDDPTLTREQRVSTLGNTLQEVQAERKRLTDEIEAGLNASGMPGLSVEQIPLQEDLPPDQAAKIKEFLNRTPGSRVSGSVAEDIESLEQLDNISKLLSRLVEDPQKERKETEKSDEAVADRIQTSQIDGRSTIKRQDEQRPVDEGGMTRHDPSNPDRNAAPGSGQPREKESELGDGREQREGGSPSAGRGESEGEKKSSTDIEKSAGPAIADKAASLPARHFLIQALAQAGSGKAGLKEEDIAATYGPAVESVLQKEDMPLNYREYIKNYFTAIGLNTKEDPNGLK